MATLLEWDYAGSREDLHGIQRAAVGAAVMDDVFGAASLLGQEAGDLRLSMGGEERLRTAGHVYVAEAEIAPTEPADPADAAAALDDLDADTEPSPLLTDAEIATALASLECRWKDERQTTLLGTEATYDRLDDLSALLDRMGVDSMLVLTPRYRIEFARSEFGQRNLNCMTAAADEVDEEAVDAEEVVEEAPAAEEPPELAIAAAAPEPPPVVLSSVEAGPSRRARTADAEEKAAAKQRAADVRAAVAEEKRKAAAARAEARLAAAEAKRKEAEARAAAKVAAAEARQRAAEAKAAAASSKKQRTAE